MSRYTKPANTNSYSGAYINCRGCGNCKDIVFDEVDIVATANQEGSSNRVDSTFRPISVDYRSASSIMDLIETGEGKCGSCGHQILKEDIIFDQQASAREEEKIDSLKLDPSNMEF